MKSASLVAISTSIVQFSSSSTFWDLFEAVWKDKKAEAFNYTPEDVISVRIAQDSIFRNSAKMYSYTQSEKETQAIPSVSGRSAINVSDREKVLPSNTNISSGEPLADSSK